MFSEELAYKIENLLILDRKEIDINMEKLK